MKSPHKPAGYPAVSPYLIVDGAAATIAFLKRVCTTWWIATKAE